ncbi:phage holin family protein [Streptomyces kebangsaanensis]|uniref:Phage holin family protein n=1 Tax=Streptomyces kebangsaanensis TaxID=864058 RepID=A0ABW6KL41_9ACTN|nr:phage holin family protein [Streptomyces kebangsaanensis]
MTGTIDARPASEQHRTVRGHSAGERPVGELVHQATEQLSQLIRQEMTLARMELAQKGRRMGRGGGLLGAAGAIGYVGLIALAGTAVAAISLALPVWAAALIVTGALFAIAGVLALTGRAQLRYAAPPKPEVTLGSVRADVEEIKERAHHR